MSVFTILIILQLIQVQKAHPYNILILNDIHYNDTLDLPCYFGNCHDLGVYGQDSPLKLVKAVLDKAAKNSMF